MQTMPPILIVTRPLETGGSFAAKVVEAEPVEVILSPGLEIVPLEATLPDVIDHLIFTSANGVAQAKRLGLPLTAHAWCVGHKTEAAAAALGFETTFGGGDALQLIETVKVAAAKGRIVHVTGQHRQGDVAATLRRSGLDCSEIIAYDQVVCLPTPEFLRALKGDRHLVIPLFSARSGLTFSSIERRAPLHVVAISQTVADLVTDWDIDTVASAESPSEAAMVDATCKVLNRLNMGSSVS